MIIVEQNDLELKLYLSIFVNKKMYDNKIRYYKIKVPSSNR